MVADKRRKDKDIQHKTALKKYSLHPLSQE
jgi:hypothetical protein